jgi:hypothetical protein
MHFGSGDMVDWLNGRILALVHKGSDGEPS